MSAADPPRRDLAAWTGVATALVAALGALVFNGISAVTTNRQTEQARQGQLTDRYAKSVEQLGGASAEVRLGGIYALERLMRDSPADQPTIVEVLAAFIRDNANRRTVTGAVPTASAGADPRSAYRHREEDILAAIAVLGRRDTRHDTARQRVDLSFTSFAGLNLTGVRLARTTLTGADFRGAVLSGADLDYSILAGADLREVSMRITSLHCAALTNANLTGADLTGADLSGARLDLARLDNVNLDGATLPAAADLDLSVARGTPDPSGSATAPWQC
ncbi:pentapeptide repeat-containing protein [Micromonospora sp. WMMD1128]|uniref:pentapeptide repeat-containing protein n=1 Tax=Micromonospora sp. WMMD1128 TaxID=3015150 RepID=UPI00248B26B2|nr:pentapeptide repeat-containing protein [Micromonospora sp. WMMD1128]WBB76533.1 pentapeptide repeat-containing protein [Micromonospora sp. WMMD1128]